jgi:hypothetical protein
LLPSTGGSKEAYEPILENDKTGVKGGNVVLSRVFDLSGFVTRDLSGRHSHLEEVTNETGGSVTGDSEDEI